MGLLLTGRRIALVVTTALMLAVGGGAAYAAAQGGAGPAAGTIPSANLIQVSGTLGAIPSGVDTQVCFLTTQSDTDGLTVAGDGGHGCAKGAKAGLRAPVAGEYLLTAGVAWLTNSTGGRRIHIEVPGNAIAAAGSEEIANPFGFTVQSTSTMVPLKRGAIVKLFAAQSSGSPLPLDGGDSRIFLTMTKVG